ncbi:MAG: CAP domain-containing protein [Hyphomicrobium sp.]|nr:CAP domain-containing protein [Hyphomicrobium sp.]
MPVLPDIPAAEAAIVEMTNAFRALHRLAPVRHNPKLAAAARGYARKLAGQSALSHTADGTTPAERIAAAGYHYCQAGENLAAILDTRGFTAGEYARRAVEGWEDSPGHRKNMLLPFVTETGVAVARASPTEPKYIAVQLFARPEAAKYSFKVTNAAPQAVAYTFNGEDNTVSPREIVTHTACLPGTITFATGSRASASSQYEAGDGQVYAIKSTAAGIAVEVSRKPR